MGTYGISADELVDPLENFLRDQEGDVSAKSLAEAWNMLAEKYKWDDKLATHERHEPPHWKAT